jgi:hypothetical protein
MLGSMVLAGDGCADFILHRRAFASLICVVVILLCAVAEMRWIKFRAPIRLEVARKVNRREEAFAFSTASEAQRHRDEFAGNESKLQHWRGFHGIFAPKGAPVLGFANCRV